MKALAEIRDMILRHSRLGEIVTLLPGTRLMASTAPTHAVNTVYQRTVLGGKVFEYSAGQYLVVSVDVPVVTQVFQASSKAPFLAFGMSLNPVAITTLLLETATTVNGVSEQPGMKVCNAAPDLLDSVARFLRLMDRNADIPVLRPMLEREILWRLLTGEQGALVRQIGLQDGRLSRISRAIQWILRHYAESLRIEELAKIAAMSPPTFFRHFRAVTAMSPLQYQKAIRLHKARMRLIAKPQNVAAVGFEVGYESASQFSREYRRLFGAPPGQDLAQVRAAAGKSEKNSNLHSRRLFDEQGF
jgi:AraC-like DNA-binding protein